MTNPPAAGRGRQPGSKNHPPGTPVEWARDVQLAERYSVSRATIWRWTKDGKLPQPARIGSCVRWRVADCDAAIVEEVDG